VRDGSIGEVQEANYDVRLRGEDKAGPLTVGGILGIALLLVMGGFGFVVFAGVCSAGYTALFKAEPTIRGPGASDPRIPRTSSASNMELGVASSLGFRNSPAGTGGDSDAGTARLLHVGSGSSGELAPSRSGKKD
jgi:hypothetical protein